jgi:plastocyanin
MTTSIWFRGGAVLVGCFVGVGFLAACGGGSGTGGSAAVNGCDPSTTMLTTGDATITFPTSAAPQQYMPNCVKIKTGSVVTWNGDFSMHPLAPDGSGPIMAIGTTMSADFTFPTAGTFGFHCKFHPSIMNGAIFVE